MDRPTKQFLEFGSFRIDTDERRLLQGDTHVPLTPKVFDLLLLLVENNRHTLTKDELMTRIWAETIVEENSLSRNISILRKTLAHDPAADYIRTVPKRGYRFDADVHVVLEDEEEMVVEKRTNYSISIRDEQNGDAAVESSVSLSTASLSRFVKTVIIAASIAIVGVAIVLVGSFDRGNAGAHSIATGQAAGAEDKKTKAYELYLRGRELWQNRSAAGLHEATLLLEQATREDPELAIAHAALADAYAFDTGNWTKVEETANHAIQLDPNRGEPYASIGFVKLFWNWDPAEAEFNFRRSITLSPDYATAHQWYAIKLAIDGRFNQSLAEMNRALELEPGSTAINADLCHVLYLIQRFDEAETQCIKTLQMDPTSFSVHSYLYDIYTEKGEHAEAVEIFLNGEKLAVNNSTLPEHLNELKAAFDSGGMRAFWRKRIETIQRFSQNAGGYSVAKYHARLGEADKALRALQESHDSHEFVFPFFYSDPVFIRCCSSDPRFQHLHELWASPKS